MTLQSAHWGSKSRAGCLEHFSCLVVFVPTMGEAVRVLLLVPNLIGYLRLLCIALAFAWLSDNTWWLFGLYVFQAALDG